MKNVFYQTETARGSASPQAAAPRRLRMKRFIALAAAILCGMNWAWAYSFSVEYYGKTLYFNIREGSYVEVTFPGNSTISPWPDGITKPTGTVTIPSTVTNPNTGTTYPVKQIGSSAFAGCTGIYQVSLPVSNLSFIGADAFYGCTGLYSIGFPSVVTEIELRAFQGCTGLTSVTIPSTVQTIGNWAFEDCTNLTSVSIYSNAVASTDYGYTYISPTNTKYDNFRSRFGNQVTSYTLGSQVTAIGKNAFYGCTGMTEIDFLGHVNSIGSRAFSGCTNLTSVDISHLTTINSDTFSGCSSLTSVTIPSSVTSIGYSAFSGCTGLTSVTIPSSVTTIDTYAFSGCTGFSSVTIPSTVQTVGNWAFANCPNLTTVTINSNAVASKNYSVTDFNGTISYSNFRSIFGNQVTCYILGSQVTGIGQRAFYDCTNIQTLYVNSTTPPTIDYLAFYNVPTNTPVHVPCGSRDAYENTTSWNSRFSNFVEECPINFADSWVKARCVVYWDINGDGELSYNEAAAVTNLGMVFYANPMESFEELQYFTGIESIPISAFMNCTSLTKIKIPNTVTSIEQSAFRHCTVLASIIIPNSVTTIGVWAFENCTGLQSITVLATEPPILGVNSSYATYAFNNVPTNTPVYVPCSSRDAYVAAEGWKEFTNIGGNCHIVFADWQVEEVCADEWGYQGTLSYNDAAAVTSLNGLFTNNNRIHTFDELQYFTGLTYLGEEEFFDCNQLTSITLPEGLTTIYSFAFQYSGLESIFIPANVTEIGTSVFAACNNLETIEVDPNNTTYTSNNGCNIIVNKGTMSVVAGCANSNFYEGILEIEEFAFDGETSLTTIVLPFTLEAIKSGAFYSCTNLTSIRVNATTPPAVGDYAFMNVPTDIPVYVPCGSLAAYQSAEGWSTFTNIQEDCNIVFEDQLVENICVDTETGWDTNGDRKLSYYEAAQVTDLGTWFQDNGIVRFNELQYFTSLTTIGEDAFMECEQLASIILPEGVTSIGKQAFAGCKELKSIIIPENVTTISLFAFYLSGLESIVIPASVTQLAGAFLQCPLQSISVHPDNLTYTSNNGCNVIVEKATNKLIVGCANSDIYEGIEAIEDDAFFYNTEITTLELPSTLQTIGVQAFQGCSNLQSIVLPASLTSIGENAFRGCRNLQTMELPANLTSIGNNAFYACRNLAEITCRAEVPPTLGTDAFKQVTTTIPVYVPCGSLAAYQSAEGWSTFTNIQEDCNITLSITGYGNNPTTTEGWHLIASPLEGVSPENVGNLLSNKYDLYQFHGSFEGAEWRNYKNNENNGFIMLYAGDGYLYANSEDVTLEFKGSVLNLQEYPVYLIKDDDTRFGNWNLVGNSFTTEATVSKTDYYRIEPGTRTLMPSSGNVNPMEGIFVEANEDSEMVTFTKLTRGERAIESPMVNIDLRNAEGHLLDRARLRTGEGAQLSKLDMLSDPNRLYFRIDGKDYAVARVNGQGEMPLHFDAAQNGTYSLNVNVEGMEMAYLHLIDNMTGEDIDLLATNGGDARHCVSTYTFTGKPSDYASRFRLVFETGSSAEGDSFAFIDAAGNIVINGEGTLQIVDVTGRVVVCRDASNASAISTSGMTAGVYVLRLINGDDVKTQKIVVD